MFGNPIHWRLTFLRGWLNLDFSTTVGLFCPVFYKDILTPIWAWFERFIRNSSGVITLSFQHCKTIYLEGKNYWKNSFISTCQNNSCPPAHNPEGSHLMPWPNLQKMLSTNQVFINALIPTKYTGRPQHFHHLDAQASSLFQILLLQGENRRRKSPLDPSPGQGKMLSSYVAQGQSSLQRNNVAAQQSSARPAGWDKSKLVFLPSSDHCHIQGLPLTVLHHTANVMQRLEVLGVHRAKLHNLIIHL